MTELNGIARVFNGLETDELVARAKGGLTKDALEIALRELATRGMKEDALLQLRVDVEMAEREAESAQPKKASPLVIFILGFLFMAVIGGALKYFARHYH
jgi:hypothetical protein